MCVLYVVSCTTKYWGKMRYTSRTTSNIIVCIVLWLLLIHIIRLSMRCGSLGFLNLDDNDGDKISSSPLLHLDDDRGRYGQRHRHDQGNAYVFYATSNLYACSAMVNVHRLTRLFQTPHPIYMLVSRAVSASYTRKFRDSYNVTVLVHEPPQLHDGAAPYYQDVMLKLLAFGLNNLTTTIATEGAAHHRKIERVIVMDADVLVLRSLDGLFEKIGRCQ